MAILGSLRSRFATGCLMALIGCVSNLALAQEVDSADASAGSETGRVVPAEIASAAACPQCGGQPAGAKQATPPHKTCCCGHTVDWTKVPVSIRPMARPGNFIVPPNGPAYFSLMDHLTGTCREQAPKSGYSPFALMPPSFFDADFRYVDSLSVSERTLVEELKRIQLNDCLMFSTGGHAWARFMNEHNSRLTENDNSYTLARTRVCSAICISRTWYACMASTSGLMPFLRNWCRCPSMSIEVIS